MTAAEKKPGRSASASAPLSYALEQLYQDQDHDWVVDTVPAVLAFVPSEQPKPPYRFEIDHTSAHPRQHHERALHVAELGASASLDTTKAKPSLRIVRALASDLVAGRTPTLDAFYRAGRGDLVARAAAKDRNDPVRILIGANKRDLEPLPRAA